MLGVLVNTGTVILGSLLGLALKKGISEKFSKAIMCAIGLCVIYVGLDNALVGNNAIIVIISLVLGTLLGTLLRIDDGLNKFGSWLEGKLSKKNSESTFSQGFVSASLLFCVGAMTIVGSLNAGLQGDNSLLYTKAIMDLISSAMLASTLGIGVLFASLTVLVYHGALVLVAGLLQGVLSDALLVAEITSVGGVMMLALGLNLVGVTKIKVADMLLSIVIAVPAYYLIGLIGI